MDSGHRYGALDFLWCGDQELCGEGERLGWAGAFALCLAGW